MHLNFYRSLLRIGFNNFSASSVTSPAIQFFSSYFSKHVILAKTLFSVEDVVPEVSSDTLDVAGVQQVSKGGTSPSRRPTRLEHKSSWTSTETISLSMCQDSLDSIDLWNGCSRSLLLLINEVVALKEQAKILTVENTSEIEARRAAIESTIQRLKHSLINLSQLQPPTLSTDHVEGATSRIQLLIRNAEAYRSAAILLLNESSVPEFYGLSAKFDHRRLTPALSAEEKSFHIEFILRTAHDIISLPDVPISWPLWPLFIAGCCVTNEDDKAVVLSLFRNAQQKTPYENISRAQKVVELMWQQREFRSSSSGGSAQRTQPPRRAAGYYEWEEVMRLKGWMLSLA